MGVAERMMDFILTFSFIYTCGIAWYFLDYIEPRLEITIKKVLLYILASIPLPIITMLACLVSSFPNEQFAISLSATIPVLAILFIFLIKTWLWFFKDEGPFIKLISLPFTVVKKTRNAELSSPGTPIKRLAVVIIALGGILGIIGVGAYLVFGDYYDDDIFSYTPLPIVGISLMFVGVILYSGIMERVFRWIKTGS